MMRGRHVRLVVVAGVLLAFCSPHAAHAQSRAAVATAPLADLDGSIEALVHAVDPTVVQIFITGLTTAEGIVAGQSDLVTTQRASGSGVIVDTEGYVVTNAHVVRGASRVRVEIPTQPTGQSLLTRRSRIVNAKIVGVDDETDLAVLKIEAAGLRALPFGDSDGLKAGQMVLAFGSPLGLHNSVSLGIVSAVARQLQPESPMVYVQTDASINPGNSGGPLVDSQGTPCRVEHTDDVDHDEQFGAWLCGAEQHRADRVRADPEEWARASRRYRCARADDHAGARGGARPRTRPGRGAGGCRAG
jgi:serine protease Do